MLEPEQTIQSQYAASPAICALVDGVNDRLDPRADIELLRDDIVDPATAQGVGLDIWARIVGVERSVNITEIGEVFSFYGYGEEPFDQGVFYNPDNEQSGTYNLSDDALRTLVFWKALANIATADATTMNKLLTQLLNAPSYVQRIGTMLIRVVTTSSLPAWQAVIFQKYGFFGKPAGVGIELWATATPVLGLVQDGENLLPFGQAPFWDGQIARVI